MAILNVNEDTQPNIVPYVFRKIGFKPGWVGVTVIGQIERIYKVDALRQQLRNDDLIPAHSQEQTKLPKVVRAMYQAAIDFYEGRSP